MKRLFLFASYDKDKVINDSLLYYLRQLSELGDIIFIMDTDVPSDELAKLSAVPNILHVCAIRHGEYDFGSYKRGYIWAHDNNKLQDYDWMYLVNDSVYGPLHSLKPLLDKLENNGADFVGMMENHTKSIPSHIQSWFLGLSKPIFTSDLFCRFISSVSRQRNKWDIVMKYEVGLSQTLIRAGYSMHAMVYNNFEKDISYEDPILALNLGVPFIKKLALANIDKFHYLYPHIDNAALLDYVHEAYLISNINTNNQVVLYRKFFRFSLFGLPIITIYKRGKSSVYKICLFERIPVIKISYN